MLINRFRHGNMILAGQTLFVLEVEPAAYAASGSQRSRERQQISTSSKYEQSAALAACLHRRRGKGRCGRA